MARKILEFIHSPMYAGKTANLLMRARHAEDTGKRVLLAKPMVDTRHEKRVIRSRCGIEMRCDLCVSPEFNFMEDVLYMDVDIVFVDEAQFLTPKQIEELREVVDVYGVSVLCYGLNTDFRKNLFEGSKRLVELCDRISELDAFCHFCSENARFMIKYLDGKAVVDGPSVDISAPGIDKFFSVCHLCWTKMVSAASEETLSLNTPGVEVVPVDDLQNKVRV